MRRRLFLSLTIAALLAGCGSKPTEPDVTYYLVRHAEKTKDKKDPALTPDGQVRAAALADRLGDVPLTAVYSSDYTRTRDTAAPTANAQNLAVQIYNAKDLPSLAETLKAQTGHILVVGHSNTTPQLAELLGAEPGRKIVEATEYDRLYVIQKSADYSASYIERYGN